MKIKLLILILAMFTINSYSQTCDTIQNKEFLTYGDDPDFLTTAWLLDTVLLYPSLCYPEGMLMMNSIYYNYNYYGDNYSNSNNYNYCFNNYGYGWYGNGSYWYGNINNCIDSIRFPTPYSGNGYYVERNINLIASNKIYVDSSTSIIDSFSYFHCRNFNKDTFVNFLFNCNNKLIINVSCGGWGFSKGSYNLSFYSRPSEVINSVSYNSNILNDTSINVFCKKDYGLIDSFALYFISFDTTGINILDTLYLGSPSTLHDTTLWNKYEINIDIQTDNVFIIMKNINTNYTNNYKSALNYDSLIIYYENQINNDWYFIQLRHSYLYDSISFRSLNTPTFIYCYQNDTSLCRDDSMIVDIYRPEFTSYLWNTGDTTSSITIDSAGTYSYTANYLGGVVCDEFEVYVVPDSLIINSDTVYLCPKKIPDTIWAVPNLDNYLWSNGSTDSFAIVNQGGMIYLQSTFQFCGSYFDSTYIIIKQNPQNIIPFSDTSVCNSFTFALQDTFASYNWSNGATSNIFTTNQTGTYWLQAETNCFSFQDTFSVTIETLQTGENTQILEKCPDDFPINLQASFTAPIYNWSNGNKNQNISITDIKNDTFSVQYSNICGLAKDIFYVKILPDYFSEPITVLRDSCTEKNYYVVAIQNQDSLATYLWNNSIQGFSFVGENQNITLQAFTACLSYEQEIILPQCPEQIKFALPTAFSPNNDGINDNFGLLYLNPKYSLEYLEIYNRWGEKIYSFKDKNDKWQGFYKNKKQEIGNYIYILKLKELDEIFSAGVLLVR